MITNKKYKDSVFRMLFNNKKEALGLYNNLYHTDYTDENAVELVTLEDVLFMPRKNDLAFLMNGKFLILLEHQSTINENMPLRFLLYVARVYEKILDMKNIYKHRMIPLPAPDFIVLYNGTKDLTKNGEKVTELELNLSDAFTEKSNEIFLELKVKVIDIRYASGHEILAKKDILQEYSHFMKIVEDCRKQETNLDKAMKQAIDIAIHQNVLADFLKKHGSEVFNMLTLEYDEKIAKEVELEEAREEGMEIGIEKGMEIGKIQGAIEVLKSLSIPSEVILQQIQEKFNLSEKTAKEYLSRVNL